MGDMHVPQIILRDQIPVPPDSQTTLPKGRICTNYLDFIQNFSWKIQQHGTDAKRGLRVHVHNVVRRMWKSCTVVKRDGAVRCKAYANGEG